MAIESESWKQIAEKLSSTAKESRKTLLSRSNARLKLTGVSVTEKPETPPSGDKHDYYSLAPYWWPNPASADGLPYIRRDGETNPTSRKSDRIRIEILCDAVAWLTLRAIVTDSTKHAEHAGRLLRGWFFEPETRMNPNLKYAQGIPGICDGRGIGIIDTVALCFLLDRVELLPFNSQWNESDMRKLRSWFSKYLTWMLKSKAGKDECSQHNNHGTWYDAQVCRFALFCGKPELISEQIQNHTLKRLESHISSDGSQPHELARTLSLNYSNFNLLGFSVAATCAENVGINLWEQIAPAIRWMMPYYQGKKVWKWQQIGPFYAAPAVHMLGLAAKGAQDAKLLKMAEKLAEHPWEIATYWKEPTVMVTPGQSMVKFARK